MCAGNLGSFGIKIPSAGELYVGALSDLVNNFDDSIIFAFAALPSRPLSVCALSRSFFSDFELTFVDSYANSVVTMLKDFFGRTFSTVFKIVFDNYRPSLQKRIIR